jgi:hypothetical protein
MNPTPGLTLQVRMPTLADGTAGVCAAAGATNPIKSAHVVNIDCNFDMRFPPANGERVDLGDLTSNS